MSEQNELTDEQCDRILDIVMNSLAKKYAANMPVECLNTDIKKHPALGRSIVMAAHTLGKMDASTPPNAQAMFDAEVAEIEAHRAKHPTHEPVVGPLRAQIRTLTAERDAALAELEEWRFTNAVDVLRRERDELRTQVHIITSERDELADCVQSLRAKHAELAARLAEIERAEPVAWVPVHPREGALWAMTTATPSDERLPAHYPLSPLYARQAQAAAPERAEPSGGCGDSTSCQKGGAA